MKKEPKLLFWFQLKLLTGIENGLTEISEAKRTGKKLQTLKNFLLESNG